MSDMTESELVQELADNPEGGILTDWLLVAKYASADSTTVVVTAISDTMDMITHLGLAEATRETALSRVRGELPDD